MVCDHPIHKMCCHVLCALYEGPNSIAKYSIERLSVGKYHVSFIPVEVGQFHIEVRCEHHQKGLMLHVYCFCVALFIW